MPTKRLSMRKIKEVLRLKWANGLSDRKIARSCGIGRPTVKKYLLRAEQAGLSWPIPEEWDDAMLEQCLFPEPSKDAVLERGLPDWAAVHQEMKKKVSPCFCCGRNIGSAIPKDINTVGFAPSIGCGWASRIGSCVRPIGPVRNCLLIMLAKRFLSLIQVAGNSRHPDFCRGTGRIQLHLCGSHLDAILAGLD